MWPGPPQEPLESRRQQGPRRWRRHAHGHATADGLCHADAAACVQHGPRYATSPSWLRHAATDDAAAHDDATRYDAIADDVAANDATTRHDVVARHDAATQYDAAAGYDVAARYDATARNDATPVTWHDASPATWHDAASTAVPAPAVAVNAALGLRYASSGWPVRLPLNNMSKYRSLNKHMKANG